MNIPNLAGASAAITDHWKTHVIDGLGLPTRWANFWSPAPAGIYALNSLPTFPRIPSASIGDGTGLPRTSGTLVCNLFGTREVGEDAMLDMTDGILGVFEGAFIEGVSGISGIDFDLANVTKPGTVPANQRWLFTISLPFRFDQVAV